MKKPTWMAQSAWQEFIARGAFCCAVCGERDTALGTVQPLIRSAGCDSLDNLQWVCAPCASKQIGRSDLYWETSQLCFDQTPVLSKFRTAQRTQAYDQILQYENHFSRPWSQISGFLYTLVWVPGAGKTCAVVAIACGLNHVVRKAGVRGAPRADAVLVLCKEQSHREQHAVALRNEPSLFGILGAAPRVLALRNGADWQNPGLLSQYDIVVACIHQLFMQDGSRRRDLHQILNRFPVVFVDEPHYAFDQVMSLVREGTQSLFFGTTGSPIEATGDALKKMVLFSTYSYQDAHLNDASMKYLPLSADDRPLILKVLGIDNAEIQFRGTTRQTDTTDEPDYPKNLWPVMSVARSVVQYVHECDQPLDRVAAPHRGVTDPVDVEYPVHAMIVVDLVETAKQVTEHLNAQFSANRAKFPREKGWHCEYVVNDSEDAASVLVLAPGKHPWLLAKHAPGYKVDSRCARFLVVVGMAREGVDNPLCGVVGVARSSKSIVEAVQRWIGRQLRSVVRRYGHALHVPPARLDTVMIITHKAFDNEAVLTDALSFVLHLPAKVDGLHKMERLIDGSVESSPTTPADGRDGLTRQDKFLILETMGKAISDGKRVNVGDILRTLNANGSVARAARIENFVAEAQDAPKKVQRDLLVSKVDPVHVVLRESLLQTPSIEELQRFTKMRTERAKYAARVESDEVVRDLITQWYREYAQSFQIERFTSPLNVDQIRRRIAGEVFRLLSDRLFASPANRELVYSLVGRAVKETFGVRESIRVGGDWDRPEHHAILARPEVRNKIHGYVVHALIQKGVLPNISAALHMTAELESASA